MTFNSKVVLLVVYLFLTFCSLTGQDTSKFNYYAVFDNILNTENDRITFSNACLSGDGSTIFFYGKNIDTDTWGIYTIKSDGTELTSIPWPADVEGVNYMTINYDGTRAFFTNYPGSNSWRHIVKVEGGVASIIFDAANYSNVNGCYTIRCTDDGEWVYFNEDRDGIWRISHNGGAPQIIVDDAAVPVPIGTGAFIGDFDISSDGSKISFILRGYYDNGWHDNNQAYCYDGSFTNLTLAYENSTRTVIRISGDGMKIVFNNAYPQAKWVTIDSDGSNFLHAAVNGHNFGGIAIDSLGEKIFYFDDAANGGHMFSSDGNIHLDLMPIWHPIFLSAVWSSSMNDRGNVVMFYYRYNDIYRLMVGHINKPSVPIDAPIIQDIVFDPPTFPDGDPNGRLNMFATVTDMDGIDDITKICNDHILNGFHQGYSTLLPVWFWADPNDNGNFPDVTAGDGIFTSRAEPGGAIDSVRQVDMRVSVQDASHNITIADKTLFVGPAVNVKNELIIPEEFSLSQNYPNPFNPSTKIKFTVSQSEYISLKVYDIIGNQITTLVNEQKSPGEYEVEFDASQLTSGVYFYELIAGGFRQTNNMMLLK